MHRIGAVSYVYRVANAFGMYSGTAKSCLERMSIWLSVFWHRLLARTLRRQAWHTVAATVWRSVVAMARTTWPPPLGSGSRKAHHHLTAVHPADFSQSDRAPVSRLRDLQRTLPRYMLNSFPPKRAGSQATFGVWPSPFSPHLLASSRPQASPVTIGPHTGSRAHLSN